MQRKSATLVDDIEEKDVQNFFKGIQNKPERKRYTVDTTRRSLSAAATTNSPRTLLTKEQMLDCATAYIDNGIVRTVIDLLVWFILGEHTKFVIEPNDELLEGLEDEEKRKVEDRIKNSDNYKELRRKLLRINKRVKLHDRLTKFLTLAFIFGRSYLEIKKFNDEEGGEPKALKILTPLRVVDTVVNDDAEFQGILYNFGKRGQEKKKIDPEDLIAAWHDDNNVFDNTFYSGASAVWTILSAAQTIETMNDENIPEFVKGIAEGFGFIYTGTNKSSVAEQIKRELKHSTIFIHNYEKMRFDKIDIARNPMELTEMLQELAKYIFQCIGAPLFILREDTANFACYSQDTQTLTENGWKYYWEILENEKIATFNPDKESLEYHIPNSFHLYDFNGDMIHFNSKQQDILVTPNHDMYYTNEKNWTKRHAEDFLNLSSCQFKASIPNYEQPEQEWFELEQIVSGNPYMKLVQTERIKMDTWLEFLGYYISEGTRTYEGRHNHIAVVQNPTVNPQKADKIDRCIKSLPYKFGSYIDPAGLQHWQIENKQLHSTLKSTGGKRAKRIPRQYLSLPKRQLQILFDALMLGDGTYDKRENRTSMAYSTASKGLADDVHELALKLGYASHVIENINKKNDGYPRQNIFRVLITKKSKHHVYTPKKEHYEGKVYCFNVENHLFVTRRNGKVAIQGNTANQVMQVFKVSKLNRFRTWVKNILEQWYDPILADHLGIELEDVISAEVRIKPVFEDINFETRLDIITADEKLMNMGVYENVDVAEDIDDQKVVRRLELQNAAVEADRDESISNELDATRRQEIIAQKEKDRLGLNEKKGVEK